MKTVIDLSTVPAEWYRETKRQMRNLYVPAILNRRKLGKRKEDAGVLCFLKIVDSLKGRIKILFFKI